MKGDKMPKSKLSMYPLMCSTYVKSIIAQYATFVEFSDAHPKTILGICTPLVPSFNKLKEEVETEPVKEDKKDKSSKKKHHKHH